MSNIDKYLTKKFKVENDKLSIPSIIVIEGVERSLVQSMDRTHILRHMTKYLIDVVAIPKEMAETMAKKYLDSKYQEYINKVLSL